MQNINRNILASKMALQGIGRRELARRSGVSIYTINSLFSRKVAPSYKAIVSISKAIGLSATEIPDVFFADYKE